MHKNKAIFTVPSDLRDIKGDKALADIVKANTSIHLIMSKPAVQHSTGDQNNKAE